MFRSAGRTVARNSGRFARSEARRHLNFSTSSSKAPVEAKSRSHSTLAAGAIAASTALAVGAYVGSKQIVYNDAAESTPAAVLSDEKRNGRMISGTAEALEDDGHLNTLVWGSNKSNLLSPDDPSIDTFRTPCVVPWLRDVALRDLALHERHGACVDARGDVYQWGDAYFGGNTIEGSKPEASLQGKDIIGVQLTATKVFALSSSGRVYALPAVRDVEHLKKPSTSSSWFGFGGNVQNCDFTEISPKQELARREKFVSISAGSDHLLALTSLGRTFALPLSPNANTYGQLGFRRFEALSLSSPSKTERVEVELVPKAVADPYASVNAAERALSVREPPNGEARSETSANGQVASASAPLYCDQLYEVPSLRGIKVGQAVAGARSSYVRTEGEERVLAWGANEYGQLGLGSNMTIDTITIPTEVVFSRSASGGRSGRCVGIASGGDLTFFLVERLNSSTRLPSTDLLSCGMGQWGALGNGLYTTAQGTPTKVRAVSGLMEYSEVTQSLQPIPPHAITVSPTGHVLLTLDTLSRAGTGATVSGRDLLVWGLNREYQLGNGKRASSATPGTIDIPVTASLAKAVTDETSKSAANIPKTQRLMLRTRKADVKDMNGKSYKKGVQVDQKAVAGWGSSLVYWRTC